MKQRIVIAQAIMEQPKILFLDEPTHTIDEEGVQLIRKMIAEEKERGALILISSHVREDIDLLADEIFYMSKGRLSKYSEDGKLPKSNENNELSKHSENGKLPKGNEHSELLKYSEDGKLLKDNENSKLSEYSLVNHCMYI